MREDKPYYELRKEMYAKGVTQQDIAEELGRGDTYVSSRFSGKGQHGFTIEDAYTILDMLELPAHYMRNRLRTQPHHFLICLTYFLHS